MDIFEAIQTRRSIGKCKMDPVKKETLFKILEAARLVPSDMNRQPHSLIVVTGSKTKEKLSSACN